VEAPRHGPRASRAPPEARSERGGMAGGTPRSSGMVSSQAGPAHAEPGAAAVTCHLSHTGGSALHRHPQHGISAAQPRPVPAGPPGGVIRVEASTENHTRGRGARRHAQRRANAGASPSGPSAPDPNPPGGRRRRRAPPPARAATGSQETKPEHDRQFHAGKPTAAPSQCLTHRQRRCSHCDGGGTVSMLPCALQCTAPMKLYVRVVPTQQLYVGVFPTQQVGPHATGIPSTEAVLRSPGQCRPAPQRGGTARAACTQHSPPRKGRRAGLARSPHVRGANGATLRRRIRTATHRPDLPGRSCPPQGESCKGRLTGPRPWENEACSTARGDTYPCPVKRVQTTQHPAASTARCRHGAPRAPVH